MLEIRKDRPAAAPVLLGSGAVIRIRPATSFEVSQAQASATRLLIGLRAGHDAARTAAAAFGEEFEGADFDKPEWFDAAAQRIAALELVMLCHDGWSGICDDAGQEITEVSRELVALLLRDPTIAHRIARAIEAPVHEERAEGNG
jgi:hypothetical protein